jgi:UrcA family protein
MHRTLLATLASVAAIAFMAAAPAAAETAGRFEAQVAYADLDLRSDAGVHALLRRINSEARDACGDRWGQMNLREHRAIRTCVREFEAAAVGGIGNARVTTRFTELRGVPRPVLLAAR